MQWAGVKNNASFDPPVSLPGSDSDHAPFVFLAGVPSLDYGFVNARQEGRHFYPAYHSGFETFKLASVWNLDCELRQFFASYLSHLK
jgi:hypothetical protein